LEIFIQHHCALIHGCSVWVSSFTPFVVVMFQGRPFHVCMR